MAKKQVRSASGRARNQETQAAILAAAAEVLQEHGYGGFGIDGVARRAVQLRDQALPQARFLVATVLRRGEICRGCRSSL
jgi:hypothetical protein